MPTPEDEDIATAVWIPLTPEDVPELEALLRSEDPFVASTIDTDDPYRLIDYIRHSIHGDAELAAVLDRNLVSRVVSLAAGRHIDHSLPGSATDRVAAACMAFFITAKVLAEPNISLYELAESVDASDGQADLLSFRIADHLHPQAYLEVALGRAPGIHSDLIEQARTLVEGRSPAVVDLDMPLRHWRRHRCALTQIAFLERSSRNGRAKFEQLIEWSVSPGFFDGVAIAFAARLFGRANPRGGLLKSVRSPNAEKCLDGIRNAAWDLTYISHWSKQSVEDEGRCIWILCTNDRVLRSLARVAVGEEGQASALFRENWGANEASVLEQQYLDAWTRAQSSDERLASMQVRMDDIDDLTRSIEAQIREACAG
ncbi:hypothetical protein KJ059_18415 [Myxococcota bacterium]|nr:hypothetical protein [Myxococcota bacterium]